MCQASVCNIATQSGKQKKMLTLGSAHKSSRRLSPARPVELRLLYEEDRKGRVEGRRQILINYVVFTRQSVNISSPNPHKDLTY